MIKNKKQAMKCLSFLSQCILFDIKNDSFEFDIKVMNSINDLRVIIEDYYKTKERLKRVLENSQLIIYDYNELEKENEELRNRLIEMGCKDV